LNLINFILLISFSFNAFALTLEEERKYDELEGKEFLAALISDKKYQEVINQFETVTKKKPELGQLYFFLGEAHFQLKNYSKAFAALEKGKNYSQTATYFSLFARTSSKLKK
jgi:tetratricopeptide (TPR) repeat protein